MGKKYLFFLGGYDLEMLTIKELLISSNYAIVDKSLHWGAKLSDYNSELLSLQNDEIPVLIELEIDCDKPQNAVIIDHHGVCQLYPSSLEQVANFLNIKLNRWQKLVATNDEGYIDAMLLLGASDSEIKDIRQKDRIISGATPQDEIDAKCSVENITLLSNIVICESLTDSFACVVDRLPYKGKKIVYNNKKLVCYGFDLKQLKQEFACEIDTNSVYFGGGEYGFFGFKDNLFNTAEIKNRILDMKEVSKPYSEHIFIFPFKFDN
ncbi:MAG: hypothetical protein RL154_1566, partial [Pseudomonadota bacterium]